MAVLTKAQMLADISNNVYTNTGRLIKGNTVRDRLLNLADSTLNRTDDADVLNGYLKINSSGYVNTGFIKSFSPAGKFLSDDGTWQFTNAAFIPIGGTNIGAPLTGPIEANLTNNYIILGDKAGNKTYGFGYADNFNLSAASDYRYLRIDGPNDYISLQYSKTAVGGGNIYLGQSGLVGVWSDATGYGGNFSVDATGYIINHSGSTTSNNIILNADGIDMYSSTSNTSIYGEIFAAPQGACIDFTNGGQFTIPNNTAAIGYAEVGPKQIGLFFGANGMAELRNYSFNSPGFTYDVATATAAATYQTQYSLLHRAAGDARWLRLTGDTMAGNLILNADATNALQAVTYQQLNAAVVGLYDLRGGYNASGNTYPTTGGSGASGAVVKADVWIITVAGTLGGTAVAPGDEIIALVDAPGQTAANWNILTHDIGYTPLSNVLTNTYIFVGNSSNVATGVAVSGDVTISNTGAVSIGAGKVTNAMLAGGITDGNLSSSYLYANGGRGLTANWDAGAYLITSQAQKVSGTGGNGYMEFVAQSSNASAPSASGLRVFAGTTGSFNWVRKNGTDTYVRTFDATLTNDRTYTLPDVATTVAGKIGTMVANYLPYWSDANQLTGSANATLSSAGAMVLASTLTLTNGQLSTSSGNAFQLLNGGSAQALQAQGIFLSATYGTVAAAGQLIQSRASDGNNFITFRQGANDRFYAATISGGHVTLLTGNSVDLRLGSTSTVVTLTSNGVASFNQVTPNVNAPIYLEPNATVRDGGWNSAIEVQATTSNPFPTLMFGNQSGTARYTGLQWTRSTSGNTSTSVQAVMYVQEPTTNNAAMFFNINKTVGTTTATTILKLSAATSTNTLSGNGCVLYVNGIDSAPNKLGFQNAGSTMAYWGAATNIPFFVYEGGSQANYRQLYFDTNGQLGLRQGGDAVPSSNFHLYGSFVGRASWTTNGSQLRVDAVQTNDTGAAGTRASAVSISFGRPTFASDTSNLITITDAATLYIANSPLAGTNMTLTNKWAVWVDNGICRFDDGILGTTTNDNATAGNIGEYIESAIATGSAVSLTTATTANITSISLTAGDWDLSILGYFKSTGASASDFELGLSTTSATLDTTAGRFNNNPTVVTGLSGDLSSVVPKYRLSLSATTTVYFVAQSTFTVGSVSVYGLISARRVR